MSDQPSRPRCLCGRPYQAAAVASGELRYCAGCGTDLTALTPEQAYREDSAGWLPAVAATTSAARRHPWRTLIAAAVILVVVVAIGQNAWRLHPSPGYVPGSAGSGPRPPVAWPGQSSPGPGSGSGGTSWWSKYDSSVKSRIDNLAAAGDCAGLQAEFDIADANDDATRDRTGSGTADLMGYIDDKMRAAACY